MEGIYAADVALEGTWFMPTEPGIAHSLLRIRRSDGDRFTIELLSASDIGHETECYGATWSGAALIPERYLRSGGPLFPVRFDGKEALVPAVLFAQLAPSERTSKNYEEIFYWRVAQDQAEQVWHDFGGR